jgi:hypothetical protein
MAIPIKLPKPGPAWFAAAAANCFASSGFFLKMSSADGIFERKKLFVMWHIKPLPAS